MFRDVPECSGMFRHVPECSMFRVLSTAKKIRVDVAWFCSLVSVYSELLFSIVFQGIASVSLYFL